MNFTRRGSTLYLRKRVPQRFRAVEEREYVWLSLFTDSEVVARAKAPKVWSQMLDAWEAKLDGAKDEGEGRMRAARELAAKRGFRFMAAPEVAQLPLPDLIERAEAPITARGVAPIRRQHPGDVARALGQQHPVKVWRGADQRPKVSAPFRQDRGVIVEHIGQRRTEHPVPLASRRSGLVPRQRLAPVGPAGPRQRSVRPPAPPRALQAAPIPNLGIAVVAARADFLAADPSVERVPCPFDVAVFAHASILSLGRPPHARAARRRVSFRR